MLKSWVTGWTEGNTDDAGLGLPFTYFTNWAYLNSIGLYNGANNSKILFPILIGEFGIVFNSSFNASVDDFSDPLVSLQYVSSKYACPADCCRTDIL